MTTQWSRKQTRLAIGERILVERKRRQLSQRALGDELGLDASQVSRIESGERRLYPEEAPIVARVLGVALADLLAVDTPEAA